MAAALLAALLIAAGGGAMSITDTTGDSNRAPDITSLDLGVSDTGLATFRVNLSPGAKGGVVSVFIDADNNPITGSQADGGAEYVFSHYVSDNTNYFYTWVDPAQAWSQMSDASAVKATHDVRGVTFSVNRSHLGDASQIRVFANSAGAIGQLSSSDRAPNSGLTAFDLAPFTLKIAGFNAAEASGRLTLTMAATHSDTGDYVSSERHDLLTCKATSGGAILPARTHAIITSNGVPEGTCVWSVAKKLKGTTLHASITESSEGRSVTKTAAVKVR